MTTLVRIALLAVLTATLPPSVVTAQVYVSPYVRRDGSMVQGHYRSAPDRDPTNNYSYPGNTNPYTGRVAPSGNDRYQRNEAPSYYGAQHQRRERW